MLCRGPAFTSQQLEVTLHSSFSSLQSLASCRLQEPAQSTATFCMTLDIIPVPWGNFSCRRKGQLVQKQNFRLGKCAAVRAAPRSAEERAHWLGEVSRRVGWREGAAGKPAVLCVSRALGQELDGAGWNARGGGAHRSRGTWNGMPSSDSRRRGCQRDVAQRTGVWSLGFRPRFFC